MRSETIRLFELASQLHTGSEELLALAHGLGMPVKSKLSKLSPEQATALREATERGVQPFQQSFSASFPAAEGQGHDVAPDAEAAEQARELAWKARIEKIRAELEGGNKEQPSSFPPTGKS